MGCVRVAAGEEQSQLHAPREQHVQQVASCNSREGQRGDEIVGDGVDSAAFWVEGPGEKNGEESAQPGEGCAGAVEGRHE